MVAALLLRLILEDPTSVPFRLNEEFEEDYLEVIERPMDLTTIHNKMDTYDDLAAFARDVRSVFANAILYYTTRDEPVAKDATLLLKKFENRLAFEKSVAETRAAEARAVDNDDSAPRAAEANDSAPRAVENNDAAPADAAPAPRKSSRKRESDGDVARKRAVALKLRAARADPYGVSEERDAWPLAGALNAVDAARCAAYAAGKSFESLRSIRANGFKVLTIRAADKREVGSAVAASLFGGVEAGVAVDLERLARDAPDLFPGAADRAAFDAAARDPKLRCDPAATRDLPRDALLRAAGAAAILDKSWFARTDGERAKIAAWTSKLRGWAALRRAPPKRGYCVCAGDGLGPMVGCSNEACTNGRGWFHLACVGLDAAPEGDWYCDACADEHPLPEDGEPPAPKKPRGRPRKPPPTGRRGRPRKHPLPEAAPAEDDARPFADVTNDVIVID